MKTHLKKLNLLNTQLKLKIIIFIIYLKHN